MAQPAEQTVYIPETVADLLATLRQRPDLVLFAGGTWLQNSPIAQLNLANSDIVWPGKIEELRRIFRNDRVLEIGAMSNFERMLHLEGQMIPPGLRQALLQTVPAPARSLATIGGNICLPSPYLNLVPLLSGWDARLELRKQGGTRLMPIRDFIRSNGELALSPGEIVTKIRLPLLRWNYQVYERIDGELSSGIPSIALCGFALVNRSLIEELRIIIALSNQYYVFNDNLDAQMVGERVPLLFRTIHAWVDESLKWLDETKLPSFNFLAPRLRGLISHFLQSIPLDNQE